VVRDEVPGPDVDEFAEPSQVIAALARPGAARRSLLAVQHPHRTPAARAAGSSLVDALPAARSTLAVLLRSAYRAVEDVVGLYTVDGPDGSVAGLLCMVGLDGVRHSEDVYPDVVADRAEVLRGLGLLTSAAMLVPEREGERLTAVVRAAIGEAGRPDLSTVDAGGRRHRVWLVPFDTELTAAAHASPLVVADGNHRVAASVAAGLDELLALVTAGPDLRVGTFHRVLIGTGLDADALRTAWRREGVAVHAAEPDASPAPGRVVVRCPEGTLLVELPETGAIDHAAVEDLLLGKALGLDPEGSRVRPLPGDRPPPAGADAVIMLAPVPLSAVLGGARMPRKSTYFTPKPRSGLVLADLR
jgi:hypothetical protein